MSFNLKRNIQRSDIGVYLMLFAVVMLISIGGWFGTRWINWHYGYSDLTKSTICEMVKPEALVDPSDCE